jgi:DNA-binding transcriptional regulator YiaG
MTGEDLRTIRRRLGLTQKQFAEQLGLHWNTVARFERNEATISGPVAKLARLLLELAETSKEQPKTPRSRRRRRTS